MNITSVRIRKIFKNGEMDRIKGIASVTFDDEFAVHDMKIVQGIERLFVAMPNRKSVDGRFQDIVHPTASNMRKKLEEKVLEEYHRVLDEARSGNVK